LTEIYTLYELDKHIGMNNVKLNSPGYFHHGEKICRKFVTEYVSWI